MVWYKVSLASAAQKLTQPFVMSKIAQVDHFAVYFYLCSGVVARHSHSTNDELFYVYRGLLSLDTDWGPSTLGEHECAVVPRGVGHSSGSVLETLVLLFQAQGEPERRNGHGRLSAEERRDTLPKYGPLEEAARLSRPFAPLPLAQVDEMSLRVLWAEGETRWHLHTAHDELLWVIEGGLEVSCELGPLKVAQDELVVVPRGRIHRLVSKEYTVVVSLIHGEVAPERQMEPSD
jgi:mannose-6-phosphate isomerase-like protein (cupin superfamily)